jgi:hypothetical protein
MKANIISLYPEIPRYQIRIVHQYSQPTVARLLKIFRVGGAWAQNLASISDIDDALGKDLSALDSQLLTGISSRMADRFQKTREMLKKLIGKTKVTSLALDQDILILTDQPKAAKDRGLINRLPNVRDAVWDSYEDQDKAKCLKGTQIDALEQIQAWVEDIQAPPIFWLNGKAGTGKSTISRIVAEEGFSRRRCAQPSSGFLSQAALKWIFAMASSPCQRPSSS